MSESLPFGSFLQLIDFRRNYRKENYPTQVSQLLANIPIISRMKVYFSPKSSFTSNQNEIDFLLQKGFIPKFSYQSIQNLHSEFYNLDIFPFLISIYSLSFVYRNEEKITLEVFFQLLLSIQVLLENHQSDLQWMHLLTKCLGVLITNSLNQVQFEWNDQIIILLFKCIVSSSFMSFSFPSGTVKLLKIAFKMDQPHTFSHILSIFEQTMNQNLFSHSELSKLIRFFLKPDLSDNPHSIKMLFSLSKTVEDSYLINSLLKSSF